MLHIEQKPHAAVINAPTQVATRSAGLGCFLARRRGEFSLDATRASELLHGASSDGAMYELFDSMARDAADRHPRSR